MKKLINRLTKLKPLGALGLFILIDVFCIGAGMGVPFFCILLGIPVGWFLVRYVGKTSTAIPVVLGKVLRYATITAGVTLVGMLIIWAPMSALLFESGNDLSTTGVPLILYEPRASFIGWLVLMVFISPSLQLLTTIFSAYLVLLYWLRGKK